MMDIRFVKNIFFITIGSFLALSIVALFFSFSSFEFIIALVIIVLGYYFIQSFLRNRWPKFFFKIQMQFKKALNNIQRRFERSFPKKKKYRRMISAPRTHVKYGKNIRIERGIFNSVNNLRQRKNLSSLTWNDSLYATAQHRAKEISIDFSHNGCPSGCGENIAKIPLGNVLGLGFVRRQNIGQKFMNTWMRSSGHRENIMRGSYHSIAIGVFQKGGKYYAVQLFV
jgi:hypothetical protein